MRGLNPSSRSARPTHRHHHTLYRADDDEPALSKRKLISLWSMLVKNMELHKYQIQQVLYQQRAQLAQQGTEVPDEHIGTQVHRGLGIVKRRDNKGALHVMATMYFCFVGFCDLGWVVHSWASPRS